jgi:hypothetical protein
MRAAVFGDPSGMVDSAGQRHNGAAASFTRRLGFQLLRIKIRRRTGTIYRAFLDRIVDGKDSYTFLV